MHVMRPETRKRLAVAAVLLSIVGIPAVDAQEDKPDQIGIMNVSGSARDLASTVAGVIDKDVAITTDAATGTIIVRGSADDVRATQALLQRIDRRPQVISLNVTLAVSDTETGKSKIVDEFRMVTLDGESAKSRFGQEIAVPSSRTISGRSLTQYTMQSVGTYVEVTPRMMDNAVAVSLNAEKSWMDPLPSADTDSIARPQIFNAEVATTLVIASGEPQSVRALVGGETQNGRVLVVTVTATLGTEADARRRAARPTPSPVRERPVLPGERVEEALRERTRSDVPAERTGRESGERGSSRLESSRRESSNRESGGDSSLRARRQAFDKDSTGSIRQRDVDRRAVTAIFSKLDADGDGSLDATEMEKIPKTLRDKDRDADQEMSRDEFIESLMKVLARRRGE